MECFSLVQISQNRLTVKRLQTMLLNCKIMPNARATSPHSYSECGLVTLAHSWYEKTKNDCTLIVGAMVNRNVHHVGLNCLNGK